MVPSESKKGKAHQWKKMMYLISQSVSRETNRFDLRFFFLTLNPLSFSVVSFFLETKQLKIMCNTGEGRSCKGEGNFDCFVLRSLHYTLGFRMKRSETDRARFALNSMSVMLRLTNVIEGKQRGSCILYPGQ